MLPSNYKIAIIEDDLAVRNLYELKLSLSDFEVRTASNGVEGLELVRDFGPQLILLDLLMPEMNGDEMLQRMREQEWGANVRVIILTNISRDEAPSVLRFMHVDRYIVKAHYTPAEIVKVVREVLHIR